MDDPEPGPVATTATVPPPPSPMQTVIVIAILIPLLVLFVLLATEIGLTALYMGFLFSTYWGAVEILNPARFLPVLVGGLLGIGVACLLTVLPAHYGTAGLLVAIAATIVPTYLMIRQRLAIACNVPFFVFLTVATIPALSAQHDYLGMVWGLLYGAAFCKAAQSILAAIMARRARADG